MRRMLLIFLCYTIAPCIVSSYRGLRQNDLFKTMWRNRGYNTIAGYHSSRTLPQPQVHCTGTTCTYAFTVSASNDVVGTCNNSMQEVNAKLHELSGKVDRVLTMLEQNSALSQLELLKEKMSDLENRLLSERSQRDKLEEQLKGQTRAIHRYRQVCYSNETHPPDIHDCQDVLDYISRKHGVFDIQPKNGPKMSVYCEDGWTVFQSREDGTTDFDRDWTDYKHGFGATSSEFWLGNDNIHTLSTQRTYKLMVEMGDWGGRMADAIYSSFIIDSEAEQYRLHLGKFLTGAAGDGLRFHENIGHGGSVNAMAFSTRDRDHDMSQRNCAAVYNGGWWYNDCFWANLNGYYMYQGGMMSDKFSWFPWKMNHYSLKTSKMKLKPV